MFAIGFPIVMSVDFISANVTPMVVSDGPYPLHIFAGVTDGYWKDLEAKGKKYMIIRMGSGDFVRSAGLQGGDLASTDIENKFTSDLVGDLIEANIPYSSLNFIAKAVLEGHSEILEYVNSDTKTVAELYAAMVENVYVRIKKVLNFDLYTKDRCLDIDYIGLDRIRLVRFLITNHYDFTIDSENNIVVK